MNGPWMFFFQIFVCPVCDKSLEEHGVDAYCHHVINEHKTKPRVECQVRFALMRFSPSVTFTINHDDKELFCSSRVLHPFEISEN